MIRAPIKKQTKIKIIHGSWNLANRRFTATDAVLATAKMAMMIIRIIEIIVVDCFFNVLPPN